MFWRNIYLCAIMKWLCVVLMLCLCALTVIPCQETRVALERVALSRTAVSTDHTPMYEEVPHAGTLERATCIQCHCAACIVYVSTLTADACAEMVHISCPDAREGIRLTTPLCSADPGSIWTPPKVA